MEYKRIMFLGASGTGKTTLAKYICQKWNIPYITSSVTNLNPVIKGATHNDLLVGSPQELMIQENQFLSLRYKEMKKNNKDLVTDRSYFDNVAYTLMKVSKDVPSCEIETIVNAAKQCLINSDISHLIFIPVTPIMIQDKWQVEDNGKRVTSAYFQYEVSSVMRGVIDLIGNPTTGRHLSHNSFVINLDLGEGKFLPVLFLEDYPIEERKQTIDKFIELYG